MAASGISEHNEARRKQNFIDKMAYRREEMLKKLSDDPLAGDDMLMKCTDSPRDAAFDAAMKHDPKAVDMERRRWILQQQTINYSAKIPYRYTSTNYNQQW